MRPRKMNTTFLMIILASVLTSCAAAGNMIGHRTLVGLLDIAGAAVIALFIFRGTDQ